MYNEVPIPFALLQVSHGKGSLHVVATALDGADPTSSSALPPSNAGKLDGIVVITCTRLVRWGTFKAFKKFFELFLLHKVCVAFVEARVTNVVGRAKPFESEVGIDCQKKRINPSIGSQ